MEYKKYVEEELEKFHCGDRLIKIINDEIREMYNEYAEQEGKGEACEDLLYIEELGKKLITNDYFAESEKYVDILTKANTKESLKNNLNNWCKEYYKAQSIRDADRRKYFN